jgi:hypothetical protein
VRRAAVLVAAALYAFAAVPASRASAAGDPALQALLEKRSPAVVSVRYVLKLKISMSGRSNDQETNREVRGAAIDSSGLVVVGTDSLEGGLSGSQLAMLRRRGAEISSVPGDFKVLFGSDAKEHEAILVAKDSRLGLSFLQLVDETAKPPAIVDLAAASEVGIGQTLYAVTRKPRGFDCAPELARILVTGKVEKPRALWSVIANTRDVGLPVYDASGAIAGVLVTQQGAAGVEEEDSASAEPFVLPLDAVAKSIEQAKKRVPEALQKAREAKEAAAKEPAKPETPPEGPGGAPKEPPKEPPTPPMPGGMGDGR